MTRQTTTQSPFPFLMPQQLRDLAAFFAADAAAVSVTIAHDGITTTVTERDLRLIHEFDASRFAGSIAECPYCWKGGV